MANKYMKKISTSLTNRENNIEIPSYSSQNGYNQENKNQQVLARMRG
jgi:hypothetical protein